MKRNTFILKCFLQFTCTNLDGSQKEGGNFINLLQKGGGFPQKMGGGGGVPTLEETMAVYDKLIAKVNNIDTSAFVLKTKYQTDKAESERKIPNVTDFVKKTKLTKLENKIPDVSSLATKTALTVVENKIPSISSLAKKNRL